MSEQGTPERGTWIVTFDPENDPVFLALKQARVDDKPMFCAVAASGEIVSAHNIPTTVNEMRKLIGGVK